jgi:hypothetical protein
MVIMVLVFNKYNVTIFVFFIINISVVLVGLLPRFIKSKSHTLIILKSDEYPEPHKCMQNIGNILMDGRLVQINVAWFWVMAVTVPRAKISPANKGSSRLNESGSPSKHYHHYIFGRGRMWYSIPNAQSDPYVT